MKKFILCLFWYELKMKFLYKFSFNNKKVNNICVEMGLFFSFSNQNKHFISLFCLQRNCNKPSLSLSLSLSPFWNSLFTPFGLYKKSSSKLLLFFLDFYSFFLFGLDNDDVVWDSLEFVVIYWFQHLLPFFLSLTLSWHCFASKDKQEENKLFFPVILKTHHKVWTFELKLFFSFFLLSLSLSLWNVIQVQSSSEMFFLGRKVFLQALSFSLKVENEDQK